MATQTSSVLTALSNDLSSAVAAAGNSIVRVEDGSRLTASGTVWSSDGIVVATSHGVERDEELTVELHDGSSLSAEVIARDSDTDIAVLRAQGSGLPAIPRAEHSATIGELALTVARPGDGGLHATLGMVGGVSEVGSPGQGYFYLSTDAVMFPGFSGGALVDGSGGFLGLLNLGYRRGRGVAIGTRLVEDVVTALVEHGNIQRGYLGISSQPVRLRAGERDGHEVGLLISSVEAGSGADKAGLLIGDVILTIDGNELEDAGDLRRRLRGKRAGEQVALEILRGGSKVSLQATLSTRE